MQRPNMLWRVYVTAFYLFLFAPLVTVAVFAFNASTFPSPPWKGFTLAWFIGTGAEFGKPGVLRDRAMLGSIAASFKVAIPVAVLAVVLGTANAFLLECARFRGKTVVAMMMLWPL
ncbi:MAG TPA: ABC transporter permease, partial [Beijerinckiaceae bacterium]|nr:ABC transporter permease [Beijerinckiaceae bacterium]